MNCQHCDYPLWNLRSNVCPECGNGFRPSDFRFAKNAVKFCCPYCEQSYYGTDANGHLVPKRFDCVGCGRLIEMDEMVLLPAAGVDERRTTADINPWLDTRKGFFTRLLATMFRGACAPGWVMRSTPVDSPPEQAWVFALLLHAAFAVVVVLPVLVLGLFAGGAVVGVVLGITIGTALVLIVLLALWIATAHGFLRLGGRTEGGIGRTAQALCYTCGPNVAVLFPCLGIYLGWIGTIWWVIAAGVGLAAAQRVSGIRAAIAVMILPVAVVGIGMAVMVTKVMGSIAAAQTVVTAGGGSTYEVDLFRGPFQLATAQGVWPVHAGELLRLSTAEPLLFTSAMSATSLQDVTLGGVELSAWGALVPEGRELALQNAAAAMPPDVIAHRLGDFVFTYHGIDPVNPPSGLWVVVEAWEPRIIGQPYQSVVAVLMSDGSSRLIPRQQWSGAQAQQDALRAQHGLPPLPDPFTVRARSPVTAPPVSPTLPPDTP